MDEHAQQLDGPSMDARQMADAIKRITMADNGELAERLDGIMDFPVMTGQGAMFYALTGKEPVEMMKIVGIETRLLEEEAEVHAGTATCDACHHANGLREPDCPNNPSPHSE